MKAKLLRDTQGFLKGQTIEVEVPSGGNKVYYNPPQTAGVQNIVAVKPIELIIGTDVELLADNYVDDKKTETTAKSSPMDFLKDKKNMPLIIGCVAGGALLIFVLNKYTSIFK